MTLKETENGDEDEEFERPDDWDRISSDELPEPDYDEHPLPDPDDLTETRVNDA